MNGAPASLGMNEQDVTPHSKKSSWSRTYSVDEPLHHMAKHFYTLVKADARSELAALKRLDPFHPDKAAFFRLLAECVSPRFLGNETLHVEAAGSSVDMVHRLAAVAAIMALRPDGLNPWGLGKAMAAVQVTDERFSMLLTARGSTFRDLARRMARRLARDADALPYLDFGRLILMEGIAGNESETDAVRIAIAREFQNAVRKNDRAAADEPDTDD